MTSGDVPGNRRTHLAYGAGKVYSVGCLPFLLTWFLLDLIGKTIIWGVASLFGLQIPPLSKFFQAMAFGVLAPLGTICIAIFLFWTYLIASDLVRKIFRKDKNDKARPKNTN